ncbi:MAG TPA: hypothetical protein VE398_05030 [Acidobacteriota bacterium]|nr:hypothetical protein [Acidobacteriota bacterium]
MAIIADISRSAPTLIVYGCTLALVAHFSGSSLSAVRPAAAQNAKPTVLRVDVDLVTVEVIALDKNGDPARSLKRENFRLFEDGKEQVISTFDEALD